MMIDPFETHFVEETHTINMNPIQILMFLIIYILLLSISIHFLNLLNLSREYDYLSSCRLIFANDKNHCRLKLANLN